MWIRGVEAEPGEDISHACSEALRIARLTNLTVWLDFNGVSICVRPDRTTEEMVNAYMEALKSDSKYKFA